MHEQPHASGWLPDGIAESLDGEEHATVDPLYGEGHGFLFGPSFEAWVAFFPEHKTVIYEDPHVYVVFKKPSRLTLLPDGIAVGTHTPHYDSTGTFGRDGTMSAVSQGPRPLTETITPADAQTPAASDSLTDDERLGGGSSGSAEYIELGRRDPSEDQFFTASTSPSEPPTEKEKQQRVKLTGRLARDITISRTSRGVPKVQFLLAEHPNPDDPDETVYHKAYSTKRYAVRIAEQELKQGEEVRVEGVIHQSVVPDRQTGELKQQEMIYAWGVKRTRPPRVD